MMTRSNSDSSNDSKAGSKMVRRKGHPFLLPMAKHMAGGADPADPCWPKTDQEIFAEAMAAFKCKVNIKDASPSRTKLNRFTGGANSGLLSPVRVLILC
jgi:hypothetical protein